MLVEAFSAMLYGAVFLSLIVIDYILGHGFVDMFQKIFCKVACFVKKAVREEAKHAHMNAENPISLPVLFMEILVLSLTIAFLNKYKQFRSKDRIDDLLHESKEALRQTNEFLEKWRLRRTLGTTRSQPERGDAGDTVNITDSTLLSVTSLLDDDLESLPEPISEEKIPDETKNIEFRNRCLWAVMEEDANNLDD
ncbi:uncharacterized protein LOC113499523 isoform X3 [Trichoplusia ni]|uniref:Uncharacterized protein LOC113499523 isoform X3 n=1 Tax=Trichoplusia ni TaxID=7111 RepID=A0A7E5W5S5_TRINI|nr:uncharacterized protein LOC113499523 isoform X3 [Trichoplusia ni]